MTTLEELIAEHSGTKGMKWGVRKSQPAVKPSTDFAKSRVIKAKHPATLSTKQLKTVNERLGLERKYSELTPSKFKINENKVKALLATAGVGIVAYNTLNSAAAKAAIARGKQIIKLASASKVVPLKPGDVINFTTKTSSAWPRVL